MANRPIFVPQMTGETLVETIPVDFPWAAGLAPSQKTKRIEALHAAATKEFGFKKILEVSTKSASPLGVSLSAFNLMIETKVLRQVFSVESAYQSSKIFQNAGPFLDLLKKDSHTAKSDPRLKNSGKLIGFRFFGIDWEVNPTTAFYDWLYISALNKHTQLANMLEEYSAFTDIEFNPTRSVSCQAYSVAIFCSLRSRGLLDKALSSKENFLKIVYQHKTNNSHQNHNNQPELQFSENRYIE